MESYILFPVRCVTCGRVLGHKQQAYEERIARGIPPEFEQNPLTKETWVGQILTDLGITNYCCRARVISAIQIPLGKIYGPEDEAPLSTTEQLEAKMNALSVKSRKALDITKPLQAAKIPQNVSVPSFPGALGSPSPSFTESKPSLPAHLQFAIPTGITSLKSPTSPLKAPSVVPKSAVGTIPTSLTPVKSPLPSSSSPPLSPSSISIGSGGPITPVILRPTEYQKQQLREQERKEYLTTMPIGPGSTSERIPLPFPGKSGQSVRVYKAI